MESQNTTQLWNNLIQDDKTTITSRQILWAYNDIQKGLTTPIGIGKNDTDLVNITINNTTHPHGIIMGMSGSGKSVALKTFALTTAALYSPHRAQLVYASAKIIDPKIKNLPHTIRTFNLQDKHKCEELKSFIDNLIETKTYNLNKTLKQGEDLNEVDKQSVILLIEEPAGSANTRDCYDTIMTIMRQTREINIHCVLVAQNPKSIHASIYDNAGWTLMFNNIVSHPYQEMLDDYNKALPIHYGTGSGYLIEQHNTITPVTIFDTTQTQWELQHDAYSTLSYYGKNRNIVVNDKIDNDKRFFLSINNNDQRDEELCKQYNLKKIMIPSDVQNGQLSLDPFFYTENEKFIADILTSLFTSDMQLNTSINANGAIDDLSKKIYHNVSQDDVNTSFEVIFGNMKNGTQSSMLDDEEIVEYVRNKMTNSIVWRSIFNVKQPEEGLGIENLCEDYDGILFVLETEIGDAVNIDNMHWANSAKETATLVSLIYNCVKNYVKYHGGSLVIDDDYYDKIVHYLL